MNALRLVGLLATLPNYQDGATFLRVDKSKGLFYDASYCPSRLQQLIIGVIEKKVIKQYQVTNDVYFLTWLERTKPCSSCTCGKKQQKYRSLRERWWRILIRNGKIQ
ncbi:uncharacterized protein EV420DRAFT_336003 [Desarmillaria tabescens]|uniref:Uncharacterized protein n=1 Tax=Armillaria tabescens TaxID=1929756 RepID=A0AA39KCY1_ARMTA|nr:uncharacterized protein EV420DRAFT_336003 [Desarmillaria tabescens]KAK0458872.1 hypothetical protein EV420DRAFT_336003 [Desarmillaria tabescens]